MEQLLVKDKAIVTPGEVLAVGMSYLPSNGTYRKDDKIIASRLGLVTVDGKVIRSIPLSGKYLPQRNDIIIGKVEDILVSGWRVEINSPYTAVLCLKEASFDYIPKGVDLTRYYNIEDYLIAKIVNVTSQNLVDISMRGQGLRKLNGGRIIRVNTHKVPRIIGKKGSMVSMIKQATGCRILVGQNGVVWVEGEPDKEIIAVDTIKKIEEKAHLSGLTDEIKNYLEKITGIKIIPKETENEMNNGINESNE